MQLLHKITILLLCLPIFSFAQVGIGTNSPNAAAQLEIYSTSKGLLIPRLTTTQINNISSPVPGLLIFNSTTQKFVGYGMGTSIESINNTTEAGPGDWYYGIDNTNMMGMSTITDDGQILPISSSMSLRSITLKFNSFNNNNNPGTVSVSLYTGNTLGSGTLLGYSTRTIAATGLVEFEFQPYISLTAGNYYFQVHAETTGINGGLAYCSSSYSSTGYIFQAQSINGSAFNYATVSGESLYFKLNYETSASLRWNELH